MHGTQREHQPDLGNTGNGFGGSPSVLFWGESFRKPVPGVAMSQCAGGATPQPVLRQEFRRPYASRMGPRGSPRSGHTRSPENRPTKTSVRCRLIVISMVLGSWNI